jgi:hypothetical protein
VARPPKAPVPPPIAAPIAQPGAAPMPAVGIPAIAAPIPHPAAAPPRPPVTVRSAGFVVQAASKPRDARQMCFRDILIPFAIGRPGGMARTDFIVMSINAILDNRILDSVFFLSMYASERAGI